MNNSFLTVHIITGLATGGAEMMLYKLLCRTNRERFKPVVISLTDGGTFGDRIADLGIPVYTIGMNPGIPTPADIWQFMAQMRQLQPDLIQGWMYHGNLAAQLAGTLTFKRVPVLWKICHSLYSLSYEKSSTAAVVQILAKLSSLPTQIIYNSKTSASQHEQLGYNSAKTLVIPNGFDPDTFKPSADARMSLRAELGIAEDRLLIGLICRFHPMKDHRNFLQAAAILHKSFPDVNFVLAGEEINGKNPALLELIQTLNLTKQVHLLGERHDMPRVTAALDIATSASAYGEGFPNVIGEAMSCSVPCVVTNVGDSGWIVGESGRVIPPRNSEALAQAWKELIELGFEGRGTLGKVARARIIQDFSLNSIVSQYDALYERLLAKKPGFYEKSSIFN